MVCGKERWAGLLWKIRGAGVLGMFLIALAGAPEPATAFDCHDYVIECTSVSECVSHLDDSCYQPGECEGAVRCRLASAYIDCAEGGPPVAMVCINEEES